jgi:hypothetical protein
MVRKRWAGSPVLDASSRRRWIFVIIPLAMSLPSLDNILRLLRTAGLRDAAVPEAVSWIISLLPWAFLYAFSGRLEFRQSGILTASGFYRWTHIESHRWIEAPGKKRVVLTLKLRGRHPLLPTPKISVPHPKKHEVEAVMARFLSEWPGSPAK